MRTSRILTILVSTILAHGPVAIAQSLDGITIIGLSEEAADVIKGHSRGGSPYLVTYVSASGTYAALGDQHTRSCVAWAQDGSYTGDSITFGLTPSEESLKLVHPGVCQPFTLSSSGLERVRLEAANRHSMFSGPLDPSAREVRYAGEHQVVARVPLLAFDWGMPVFSRHDIKGVPLGPVPALKERLGADARFELGPLQRLSSGTRKVLRITAPNPADPARPPWVAGHVAAAEVLGWPWDVLYAAEHQENLADRTLVEVFEQAVIERYGEPSRSMTGIGAGTRHLHWFFGLDGRQLSIGSAAPENCLSIREHWIDEVDLKTIDRDIGPWGCALIMLLIHDGEDGIVRRYSIQAVSGYVMALNHFVRRLEEVRAMREKIQDVQAYRPKL